MLHGPASTASSCPLRQTLDSPIHTCDVVLASLSLLAAAPPVVDPSCPLLPSSSASPASWVTMGLCALENDHLAEVALSAGTQDMHMHLIMPRQCHASLTCTGASIAKLSVTHLQMLQLSGVQAETTHGCHLQAAYSTTSTVTTTTPVCASPSCARFVPAACAPAAAGGSDVAPCARAVVGVVTAPCSGNGR
jgi:hypothetical protein